MRQAHEDEAAPSNAQGVASQEPTRQLLYLIAQARATHPALDALRDAFDLEVHAPSEAELDHARGSLAGRNRDLLNTVGGVVQPGNKIVEIVPLDDALILEARIKPQDIAFLRPGQTAMVKFTAYDFSIYGGLEAEVEHISADTVTDERGNTFYVVRVRTRETVLGEGLPIIPGMVAQVDVLTGKKTILSYLLKPVLRAKANALTER